MRQRLSGREVNSYHYEGFLDVRRSSSRCPSIAGRTLPLGPLDRCPPIPIVSAKAAQFTIVWAISSYLADAGASGRSNY